MANGKSKWSTFLFSVALMISLGATLLGIYALKQTGSWALLDVGAGGLVFALATWGICRQIAAAREQTSERWEQFMATFTDRMEQFSVMLNVISEQQLLSDRGKTVVFRDKDRDALRRAIREEMARGQYDAALVLVNDMETAFGHKQEADVLRHEIEAQQDGVVRRVIGEAIGNIDRACTSEKWDEALWIARETMAHHAGHPMAITLEQHVLDRKNAFKQQLLNRWKDAVARKDIDGSVAVLRQLDMYVSPEEVEQLKDGALEIFKIRIEQLREKFKQSVYEKKWNEVMQLAEDIITDFPTSKLAQEVRGVMEMVRNNNMQPGEAIVVPAGV